MTGCALCALPAIREDELVRQKKKGECWNVARTPG